MDYATKHELILYGWKGQHKFYGGFQTSVLEFDKPLKSNLHPTMKPVELLTKLIKNSTLENMIVYDPFLGSGSTLIACEQTNRVCYGMELDPHYIDVIIQRWENYTGKEAVKLPSKDIIQEHKIPV
jgi:DNA modification methylase